MSANFEDDSEFHDAIPKPRPRRRSSLVELLVALGIIVLLIGLFLPTVRSARPAARRLQCASNLRQIAQALHDYEQAYKALPPAYTVDAQGRPLHSWRTLILPYLERDDLYRTIDLSKPWNDPVNAKAREASLPVFRCFEAAGPGNSTTYLAIATPDGCFPPGQSRRLAEITDAHESTLMVIEAGEENAVLWMAPMDADESLVTGLGPAAKLHHAGGFNACFVDGGARFLGARTPAPVRRALMSISGNDNPSVDEW